MTSRITAPASERTSDYAEALEASAKTASGLNQTEKREGMWKTDVLADRGQWRASVQFIPNEATKCAPSDNFVRYGQSVADYVKRKLSGGDLQ